MENINFSNSFDFLNKNRRKPKPRNLGITEIRAAYYTPFGKSYFQDLLDSMDYYIDSIKFAGGSFTLMPDLEVRKIIETAHKHDVMVSTGGFLERVITQGKEAVLKYIRSCKNLGFDIIEVSTGFISLPTSDWQNILEEISNAGLKPKPEIGVQFGAGGDSSEENLKEQGIQNVGFAIQTAKKFIEAGVDLIMIESEGITENTNPWRTEVPAAFINEIGLEKLMFEAADPKVFEWYIQNYGPEVNLFVDHSQIIQLECLRAGIWGTNNLWGRVWTYG